MTRLDGASGDVVVWAAKVEVAGRESVAEIKAGALGGFLEQYNVGQKIEKMQHSSVRLSPRRRIRGGQAEAIGPQISPATEGEGKRRSLATGMFCVALPNADPTALQEGLNWACGQGHANCAAIQPGGPCYKANNLPAFRAMRLLRKHIGSSMAGGTTPAANAPSAVGPFTPGFGNGSSPTFPGTGSPGGALTPFDAADSVMSGARRALCALLLASPIFLSLVL
uniref:X8 domain-containing protein n=1 Tax=Oryza glumipatula TaxID=40148 RepID=A0A0E0AN44_9ORYZ